MLLACPGQEVHALDLARTAEGMSAVAAGADHGIEVLDERARKAVGRRVRDALERIERAHPPLGAHLRATIKLGTFCSYEPATPAVAVIRIQEQSGGLPDPNLSA